MTVLNQYYENDSEKPTNKNFIQKYARNVCSLETVKKIFPILQWLPYYNSTKFIQDIIAGITVGLTAIPQGIAYAVIAGLPPEYGLYSGLFGGIVYVIFGSCKAVTIGPTAIVSAIVAKYVKDNSADFAVLACFLSGLVQVTMGLLNLGCLVQFISMPVISGFTFSAALQIAASQLKSFFGLTCPSGNHFSESIVYFFQYITTAKLWDTILSVVTVVMLIFLLKIGKGRSKDDGTAQQIRWFISLSRNAIVVIFGIIVGLILKLTTDSEPLALIGDIGSGLPTIKPPPFSTVVGNETYDFTNMLEILGPKSIIIPMVSILELVAIAKAFSDGIPVDATQELIAVGLCNVFASFGSSMPITGSFTRTALNHASGVETQTGGIFNCFLIYLSLSFLTSSFYYIPKASLAGLIIFAMYCMIDLNIFGRLWFSCKREFMVLIITILFCLTLGLEYGIIVGILIDVTILLYKNARPDIKVNLVKNVKGDFVIVPLSDGLLYCAAEHIRKKLLKALEKSAEVSYIFIDATNLKYMDSTVASNLLSAVEDLEKKSCKILFLNFNSTIKEMCLVINPEYLEKFIVVTNVEDFVGSLPKMV